MSDKQAALFGTAEDFKGFVFRMEELFPPMNLYKYDGFAVFDFKYTVDAEKFENFLEMATMRYQGVYWSRSHYLVVCLDASVVNSQVEDKPKTLAMTVTSTAN
jgi:hypothetical protein